MDTDRVFVCSSSNNIAVFWSAEVLSINPEKLNNMLQVISGLTHSN